MLLMNHLSRVITLSQKTLTKLNEEERSFLSNCKAFLKKLNKLA